MCPHGGFPFRVRRDSSQAASASSPAGSLQPLGRPLHRHPQRVGHPEDGGRAGEAHLLFGVRRADRYMALATLDVTSKPYLDAARCSCLPGAVS
jgi:hypothetical protein